MHYFATGTCILHTDSGLRQALFCYSDLHSAHWFSATTSIIFPQGLTRRVRYCTLIQGYRHCLVMCCICCYRTTLIGTNYHVDPLETVSSLSPTGCFTLVEHTTYNPPCIWSITEVKPYRCCWLDTTAQRGWFTVWGDSFCDLSSCIVPKEPLDYCGPEEKTEKKSSLLPAERLFKAFPDFEHRYISLIKWWIMTWSAYHCFCDVCVWVRACVHACEPCKVACGLSCSFKDQAKRWNRKQAATKRKRKADTEWPETDRSCQSKGVKL